MTPEEKLRRIALLVKGIPQNPDSDYKDEWELGHDAGQAFLARRIIRLLEES